MFLRKDQAGTTTGHVWDEDGAVVEVPDELGAELLALPAGGFAEVDEPEPAPEPSAEPPSDEPKRPNQAASAEEWKAYALATGLPEDVVNAATRKAIIDHFTGGTPLVPEDTSTEG